MFVYTIGSGEKFSFWYDPWCHGKSLAMLFPEINLRGSHISKKAVASDFWRNGRWHVPTRWDSNMTRVLNFLQLNFILDERKQDVISWGPDRKGEFHVKSALKCLVTPAQKLEWTKLVWSRSIIPRHCFILWSAVHNRLKTKKKLYDWGIIDSNVCGFCNVSCENVEHLFFQCDFIQTVWSRILVAMKVHRRPFTWRREVSWFMRKANGKTLLASMRRTTFAASVYAIWKVRNELIFQKKTVSAEGLFQQVREIVFFNGSTQKLHHDFSNATKALKDDGMEEDGRHDEDYTNDDEDDMSADDDTDDGPDNSMILVQFQSEARGEALIQKGSIIPDISPNKGRVESEGPSS
ncbi:Reverse transcriptase zinc-binding domain-containing protein [Dioscorea alata]|uniref:Reverse transcriptase zinc-binding domain-containing protein n=1 Tax=Dioscorea alata TaxID=55571 RepID=A0ACB7VGL9_DIOAL|nr:Reverse transcriptase zinc-binding domain-containing protein [Dioscorea alata]